MAKMKLSIEKILKAHGLKLPLPTSNDEFFVKIENKPYMSLCIERVFGYAPAIAVQHSYVLNGDVMFDPEIVYRMSDWQPLEITQDAVGIHRRAIDSDYMVKDVLSLSSLWAKNLLDQGFADTSRAKVAKRGE